MSLLTILALRPEIGVDTRVDLIGPHIGVNTQKEIFTGVKFAQTDTIVEINKSKYVK